MGSIKTPRLSLANGLCRTATDFLRSGRSKDWSSTRLLVFITARNFQWDDDLSSSSEYLKFGEIHEFSDPMSVTFWFSKEEVFLD